METAYVVKGRIINHTRIELSESIPFNDEEVTVIIESNKNPGQKRIPGLLKGKIRIMPDFNEPLEDFREYME